MDMLKDLGVHAVAAIALLAIYVIVAFALTTLVGAVLMVTA